MRRPIIRAYTDGSCLGNPGGFGGWAYALVFEDSNGMPTKVFRTRSGGELKTTNNRMELTAVENALEATQDFFTRSYDIHIYTDSQYIINTVDEKWKASKNLDIWNQIQFRLAAKYDEQTIEFYWVKAHSGDIYNDLVDNLAVNAASDLKEWTLKTKIQRRKFKYLGRQFSRRK